MSEMNGLDAIAGSPIGGGEKKGAKKICDVIRLKLLILERSMVRNESVGSNVGGLWWRAINLDF